MSGPLGYSWADTGAVVGALVGGLPLGRALRGAGMLGKAASKVLPAEPMWLFNERFTPAEIRTGVGSAVFAGAGAALFDRAPGDVVLQEAGTAFAGAATGAWLGKMTGSARVASKSAQGGSKSEIVRLEKALGKSGSDDYLTLALPSAAFNGFLATINGKQPINLHVRDIGNGGCPVEMSGLQMPEGLEGPVADLYLKLPDYLCSVWRAFGEGGTAVPAPPKLPTNVSDEDSGIDEYETKAGKFNDRINSFAGLDQGVLDLIRQGVPEIIADGHLAVNDVIDAVNKRAGEPMPQGRTLEKHSLDIIDAAIKAGADMLVQADTRGKKIADNIQRSGKALDPDDQAPPEDQVVPDDRVPESPEPHTGPGPEVPGTPSDEPPLSASLLTPWTSPTTPRDSGTAVGQAV